MNNSKKFVGTIGENIACRYLIKKNYEILTKNYHTRYGEIDIVAVDGSFIVFVEVKLRKFCAIVSGVEAIDTKKQKKIIKSAMVYLSRNGTSFQPRFDIIELTYFVKNGSKYLKTINHIKNAFTLDSCDYDSL